MQRNPLRSLRNWLYLSALTFATLLATGCGLETVPYLPTVKVAPLATDDLRGPCTYELKVSAPTDVETSVLVIFQRGDSGNLFADPDVQAMAASLHMAMVYALECDAASYPDLQIDASKGPGRALFVALDQLGTLTGHTELANANVLLFGFSAAGYLSMTMANDYSSRVLGGILLAPASSHADIDDLAVTPAAAAIPMLILANAWDQNAGTQRPFDLFIHGQVLGGRWGFGVQNGTGHCCTDSTKTLLIPWVTAVMEGLTTPLATGQAALAPSSGPAPPTVQFTCTYDGHFDDVGNADCNIIDASVLPATAGGVVTGWMPDSVVANAWLDWVTSAGTN